MLIEYKIKFEKDGITIAQQIEPNSARLTQAAKNGKAPVTGLPAVQQEVKALAPQNPLATAGGPGDPFGGGPGDPFGGGPADPFGGGAPASAPIFILGPIVFGGSVPTETPKSVKAAPDAPPRALGHAAGE